MQTTEICFVQIYSSNKESQQQCTNKYRQTITNRSEHSNSLESDVAGCAST